MQEEKKKLNMFNIFCLGLGSAIGSGIFVMMGYGIAFTGRSVVLAVIAGCILTLLAYLYHPVMASMFVLPGGDYDIKAMLFGPKLTGISAVMILMDGFGFALFGTAIVEYIGMVFPGVLPYTKIIAVGIITLFFAATIKGTKFVANLNSFMTVVLLCAIVLFIVVGIPQVQSGFFGGEDFFVDGAGGFVSAIAIMSIACMGTTTGPVSMMSVTKKPKVTIPVAILLVIVCLAAVYGLMSVVASGVLPYDQVAGQSLAPVAE